MAKKFLIICTCLFIIIVGGFLLLFTIKKQIDPKIKNAEFPFLLTYKHNEELVTVEGTYVCEYDGVGWDSGRMFYRKWKGYVKETGLENVLICEDSERRVFCQVGEPRYYMGDFQDLGWDDISLSPPHLYIVKKNANYEFLSVDEIKQVYAIEIVSWEFSNPIQSVD